MYGCHYYLRHSTILATITYTVIDLKFIVESTIQISLVMSLRIIPKLLHDIFDDVKDCEGIAESFRRLQEIQPTRLVNKSLHMEPRVKKAPPRWPLLILGMSTCHEREVASSEITLKGLHFAA
jgi:hypothetical protein